MKQLPGCKPCRYASVLDYQGNIVEIINTATGAVEQMTDYYPYGMPHADSVGAAVNRHKYTAKELVTDQGLDAYDFAARWYTPAMPRFTTVDPCADSYHPISPYTFCTANPINLTDPTGENAVIYVDEEAKTLTFIANYYVVTKTYKVDDTKYSNRDINKMNCYSQYLNNLNLQLDDGEFEGYIVCFNLNFIDGGLRHDATLFALSDESNGISIGNVMELGDESTYKNIEFKPKYDDNGNYTVTGGITFNKYYIVMNKPYDTKPNRIHEIFHTFGMEDVSGGKTNGVMGYPPHNPTKNDIKKIIDRHYIPIIIK